MQITNLEYSHEFAEDAYLRILQKALDGQMDNWACSNDNLETHQIFILFMFHLQKKKNQRLIRHNQTSWRLKKLVRCYS